MGGINLYQYAPNPLGWVDPFGLACYKATRTDKGVSVDKKISRKNAIGRLRSGKDVFVESIREARSLSKAAGRGKPMRHKPHPDKSGSTKGRLPHMHPNQHQGPAGNGHIFYPDPHGSN